MKKTQNDRILAYLLKGKSLTPIGALSMFGCFRLASRIRDLKNEGWTIRTEFIKRNGKRYANYYMPDKREIK
jgi:hypothetical protein